MKCVAANSPAAFTAQHSRQYIHDRIDIGRDVQTPPFMVVAGIDDDREIFRRNNALKPVDKLRATGSTCQDNNHAALLASPCTSAAAFSLAESNQGLWTSLGKNSG